MANKFFTLEEQIHIQNNAKTIQLIKLASDHYVVISNEQINKDDWFLNTAQKEIYQNNIPNYDVDKDYLKKITHSTKYLKKGIELPKEIVFIPLIEVKSLIGEVDVVELSKNATKGRVFANGVHEEVVAQMFYRKGYNQCVEDYTKEIHEVLNHLCDKMEIITQEMIDKDPFQLGRYRTFKYVFDYLKSISQPKDTWEVYFDSDNKLKLK